MKLSEAKLVGFVMTNDAPRAKKFYEEQLGLPFVSDDPFALVFELGGSTLRVVKMKDWKPHPHTVLGWEVPDVRAAVLALRERGVVFEKYDYFEQDDLLIWNAPGGRAKLVWFKDPDGNVLSMSEHA